MNEDSFNQMLEIAARRRLTVAEEAELQQHIAIRPDRQACWEEEMALNHALDQLPDSAISSNFTSRVMQAIDLEERQAERKKQWPILEWLGSIRLAKAGIMGALVVFAGLATYQQYRLNVQSSEVAEDLVTLAKSSKIPSIQMLKDFDAINGFGQMSTTSDEKWMSALQ
jgi:anti-sigma factor RsiW